MAFAAPIPIPLVLAGITPDMPITLVVAVFGCVMSLMLPAKYAIIPLAVSMCAYPSECLIPPPQIQVTAQRLIGVVLLGRCLFATSIRSEFKWQWVDSAAVFYYLMLLLAQCMTAASVMNAVNNRIGFFLSALVPYWCVRFLVNTRQRLYVVLKTFLWTAAPLALLGVYQMMTSQDPYSFIMQYTAHWPQVIDQMVTQRPILGTPHFRATGPFMQCIMYGWFFAIWVALGTNLYFEKKSVFPWIFPWLLLPVGAISTISAGPMTMAAIAIVLLCCFPFRRYWKIALGVVVIGFLGVLFGARRSPMEIIAGFGFDASSSWYRVALINYTTNGSSMKNHWLAGYGEIPAWWAWHDLCIQWIELLVFYGMMGVTGFYVFVGAAGAMLWKGKQRAAESMQDQWLLWSLMAAMIGAMLGMFLVSLFGEMYFIYHFVLGLAANAYMMVGSDSADVFRDVGVMAEVDGRPVMLRYRLRSGQKLAVIHPPAGIPGPFPKPVPGNGPSPVKV